MKSGQTRESKSERSVIHLEISSEHMFCVFFLSFKIREQLCPLQSVLLACDNDRLSDKVRFSRERANYTPEGVILKLFHRYSFLLEIAKGRVPSTMPAQEETGNQPRFLSLFLSILALSHISLSLRLFFFLLLKLKLHLISQMFIFKMLTLFSTPVKAKVYVSYGIEQPPIYTRKNVHNNSPTLILMMHFYANQIQVLTNHEVFFLQSDI